MSRLRVSYPYMKNAKEPRRKNYSISPEQARTLAHISLQMSEDTNKTIRKQHILDVLVDMLNDAKIYRRVLSKAKAL